MCGIMPESSGLLFKVKLPAIFGGYFYVGYRRDRTFYLHFAGGFLTAFVSPLFSLGLTLGMELSDGRHEQQMADVLDILAGVLGLGLFLWMQWW